jgi:hypothetical protein
MVVWYVFSILDPRGFYSSINSLCSTWAPLACSPRIHPFVSTRPLHLFVSHTNFVHNRNPYIFGLTPFQCNTRHILRCPFIADGFPAQPSRLSYHSNQLPRLLSISLIRLAHVHQFWARTCVFRLKRLIPNPAPHRISIIPV